MVIFSLAGFAGLGVGSGANQQTQNTEDLPPRDYGRVVCSTSNLYHAHANLMIKIDDVIQPAPLGIGVIPDCSLEIRTEDESGDIHIESDENRGYTWAEFFNVWGISPMNAPGFVLVSVILDEEDNPGQSFDFNTIIEDGQEMVLEYISIPTPSP